MGLIKLDEIIFSDAVREDWHDSMLWEKLKAGEIFTNPSDV